jgi:5'-3' exoribonuclease 2
MKSHLSKAILATAMLSLVACQQGPNGQTGAVMGAGLGALGGAIIGNQSGRALEGAAIGGLIGGVAGNQIGGAQDQRNYQRQQYYQQQQQPAGYDQYGRPYYR